MKNTNEKKILNDARKKLTENQPLLNEIRVCYSKAYLLMNFAGGYFQRATDLLLDNNVYNSHLLGKDKAVERAMEDFYTAYEKHLGVSLKGFGDMYDELRIKINNVLDNNE